MSVPIYDGIDGVAQRLSMLVYVAEEGDILCAEALLQALQDEAAELTLLAQQAKLALDGDRAEKAVADLTDAELEIRQVTRRMDDE